jgi:hypothetical protein
MGQRSAIRRLLTAIAMTFGLALLSGCAAGRPTSLIRLPEGYEVLTAHCEASPPATCQRVRTTSDPGDEEAWGFRARPPANALWREPEVLYAVGNRARCDEVRAVLGTPTEACWGPVFFKRE